jgi:hypothetical protein
MVNIRELLINTVMFEEPKMLTGSTQNGKWLDISVWDGNTRTTKPSVKRQDLNHSFVSYAEHDKPASLPQGQVNRKEHCWRCGQRIAEKAKATL